MRYLHPLLGMVWTVLSSVVAFAAVDESHRPSDSLTENTVISLGLVLTLVAATWWISRKFAYYDVRLREGSEMFKELREAIKDLECVKAKKRCPSGTAVVDEKE